MFKIFLTFVVFFVSANFVNSDSINDRDLEFSILNNGNPQTSVSITQNCVNNQGSLLKYWWIPPIGDICVFECSGGACCKIEIVEIE